MARNNYWENKFKEFQSVYDDNGNLKNFGELGYSSLEELDNAIDYALKKGWGSIHSKNGSDYTIYAKNKNNGLIYGASDVDEDKRDVYNSAGNLGAIAAGNYRNKSNPTTWEHGVRSIYNTPAAVLETTPSTEPVTPAVLENNYSGLLDRINKSMPSTGRNSLLRTQYNKLFGSESDNYLNSPSMSGYINRYYGHGWKTPETKRQLQLTANFVANNGNLATDRRGKGEDYLVMESSRLNRTLGNYDRLTYRDMLNYFNNNLDIGNLGKYRGNNEKFMQELYELGASRNGMLEHELKRLFGEDYDKILRNIRPSNMKYGGILEMLFI